MADGSDPSPDDDGEDTTAADAGRAVQTALAGAQAVAGVASAAASGGDPGQIATGAVASGASVAAAAAPSEVTSAIGVGAQALQSATGIAQAAEAGNAAGAATSAAAGAAGVASGAAGATTSAASQAAQSVGQATRGLEAIEDVAELISQANPQLEHVEFDFALTEGPEIQWSVQRFSCTQELSNLYEIRVELDCGDVDAAIDEMLGAPCEFAVVRGELLQAIYGIVDEVEFVRVDRDRLHAVVRVVPALAMLRDTVDTRYFQGMTVPEILADVLGTELGEYGREVDTEACLQGEYNVRDYCAQFRESTLAFCSRLMEEEGIAYFFAPDADGRRERLVLIDSNADYGDVELVVDDEVPIIAAGPDEADRESIQGFGWTQQRAANKVTTRAYNVKAADAYDDAVEEVEEAHNHRPHELYLHDDRRQIIDDPVDDPQAESFTGADLEQRAPMALLALQRQRLGTKVGHGVGNVTGFAPGRVFTFGEHPREDVDSQAFLLIKVVHSGYTTSGEGSGRPAYHNDFVCCPRAHEFRPSRRTPRPRVHGPQLGRVVGPQGSEIHTDALGRIKVQFHADRLGEANDTASCWMRVTQSWAGPQWGSFFVPRVGMEVVVQFVDGNPDCPVVTGCVYNSENTPPYTMPDEKTKSTIKTSSSAGGDGYNELTFEDAAGLEQIIVHAQKDFNKVVENDQSRNVGCNDSTSVGGNQSLSVSGDRSHSVSGHETVTVTGSQKVTITGSGTGDGQDIQGAQLDITGEYKLDASQHIEVQAPNYIKLTVGDTYLKIEPDRITLHQKDGADLVLSPEGAAMKSKENSRVTLDTDAQMQASTGGDLMLTADAQLTGQEAQVLLDGEALVRAAGEAELKLNGDVSLTGANSTVEGTSAVTVQSDTEATFTAGGSTVKANATMAEVTGAQVNIAGNGAVGITGGVIKLN